LERGAHLPPRHPPRERVQRRHLGVRGRAIRRAGGRARRVSCRPVALQPRREDGPLKVVEDLAGELLDPAFVAPRDDAGDSGYMADVGADADGEGEADRHGWRRWVELMLRVLVWVVSSWTFESCGVCTI